MSALIFTLEQVPTPTGNMMLLTDASGGVRALDWSDHEARMFSLLRRGYPGRETRLERGAEPSKARRAVEAYFDGERHAFDGLELETGGTPFQRELWTSLRSIPWGTTTSYGALAVKLGRPRAMRAVGAANGANPIAIIQPCHRVIGADGSLTGFGGGIERKRWLLAHEGFEPRESAPETLDFESLWRGETR